MLGLVATEEARRLDLGGGAAGQLLVEVDHPLHPDSIRVGSKGLSHVSVPSHTFQRTSTFIFHYPFGAGTTIVGRDARYKVSRIVTDTPMR